jgi:hypothetical protein
MAHLRTDEVLIRAPNHHCKAPLTASFVILLLQAPRTKRSRIIALCPLVLFWLLSAMFSLSFIVDLCVSFPPLSIVTAVHCTLKECQ